MLVMEIKMTPGCFQLVLPAPTLHVRLLLRKGNRSPPQPIVGIHGLYEEYRMTSRHGSGSRGAMKLPRWCSSDGGKMAA